MADIALKDIIEVKAALDDAGHPIGRATIGLKADYKPSDVDALLAEVAKSAGTDAVEQHKLLAQQIMEPIEQVVPYAELYTPLFFQEWNVSELDDWSIPIEDIVAMAWQTHGDGGVNFVQVGSMTWTRPTLDTWNEGIKVPWKALRYSGWNFLARQMRRAAEALARKRDIAAQYVLDAAITGAAGHFPAVAGGVMTKSSVDTLIKNALSIGFPVTTALINTGVLTDMSSWFPTTVIATLPQRAAEELLTTLYVSNYGNINWFASPHASSTFVYFGGPANQIGWHITKGQIETRSDIDIREGVDLHRIDDAYHAWYVGNANPLRRLTILS